MILNVSSRKRQGDPNVFYSHWTLELPTQLSIWFKGIQEAESGLHLNTILCYNIVYTGSFFFLNWKYRRPLKMKKTIKHFNEFKPLIMIPLQNIINILETKVITYHCFYCFTSYMNLFFQTLKIINSLCC